MQHLHAQEEESAAVSLEELTDEFQEHFFEGLKQKGIENYDKAVNSFLECKRLDSQNPVVDHELAKASLAAGQAIQALEYAIMALNTDPGNFWYLETLYASVQQQGATMDAIADRIPFDNPVLREHLAGLYFNNKEYQNAMELLKGLEPSASTHRLASKIGDSLAPLQAPEAAPIEEEVNPLEAYRRELEELLERSAYEILEERAAEALERFPSFPYFYYVQGLVKVQNKQYQAAVSVMEEGLDYLFDDPVLADKMYKALATAYTALGNISKANMYLSKIKSGS